MPKRVDSNQAAIVEALRQCGASVQPLHTIGKGCADVLCGYRGVNYLLEIKDGSQPPSKQKLTPAELRWHDNWRGTSYVVNSIEQALSVIGAV